MNWIESISKSIEYNENNITENISIDDVARNVYISPLKLNLILKGGYTMEYKI